MPNMLTVASSTINAVGYDPAKQQLDVLFKSGPETYRYEGVAPDIYSKFLSSKSKGLFHAQVIKGKYKFSKQRPIPPPL